MKKKTTIMFTQASLTIYNKKLINQSKRRIMKNQIVAFAVMGFMAGTLLTGCEKTPEQKLEASKEKIGEAKQELKDVQAERAKEWQAFKTESEQQIADNDKRIDAFKEKMDKAGPKAKAKYSKEVAELKKKNHELKEKLEDYKDGDQSKWQEFKTNFKADMDAVGKTMKDLFKDKD
jgi:DNA repair exonuclease SbcCD ATPase subunit